MTEEEAKVSAFKLFLHHAEDKTPNVWIGKIEDKGSYYFVQGGIFGEDEKPEDGYLYCLVDKSSRKAQFPGGINMAELIAKYDLPV